MAVTFAVLTSHPSLLGCQLARLDPEVALSETSTLNVVGVGTYAQEDVLLQRSGATELPARVSELRPMDDTEALLYQAQHLPPGASLEAAAQPFRFRRWMFLFRGALEGFLNFRGALYDTLPPYLQRQMGVDTEGEAAFSVFLKHLRDAGRTDDKRLEAGLAAELLQSTARTLQKCSRDAGTPRASEFQLIATNANLLLATRVGVSNPLFYRLLEGSSECQGCRLSVGNDKHPLARAHALSRAVAVASHVVPGARWLELGDGKTMGVGTDLRPFER